MSRRHVSFATFVLLTFCAICLAHCKTRAKNENSRSAHGLKGEQEERNEDSKKKQSKQAKRRSFPPNGTLVTQKASGHMSGLDGALLVDGNRTLNAMTDSWVQVSNDATDPIYLTIDSEGTYQVVYYANEELGYIDLETQELLFCGVYNPFGYLTIPALACRTAGKLTDIPDGAIYENGRRVRSGSRFYHQGGNSMLSSGTWYDRNGYTMKSSSNINWPRSNRRLKSSSTFYYENGNRLKQGSTIYYANGNRFINSDGTANDKNGYKFKTGGRINYQDRYSFISESNYINYPNRRKLRDEAGTLFYETGYKIPTSIAWDFTETSERFVLLEAYQQRFFATVYEDDLSEHALFVVTKHHKVFDSIEVLVDGQPVELQIEFGDAPIDGSTKTIDVELKNNGTQGVVVFDFDSIEFPQGWSMAEAPTKNALGAGQSLTVRIGFSESELASGVHVGEITIPHSGISKSIKLPVRGSVINRSFNIIAPNKPVQSESFAVAWNTSNLATEYQVSIHRSSDCSSSALRTFSTNDKRTTFRTPADGEYFACVAATVDGAYPRLASNAPYKFTTDQTTPVVELPNPSDQNQWFDMSNATLYLRLNEDPKLDRLAMRDELEPPHHGSYRTRLGHLNWNEGGVSKGAALILAKKSLIVLQDGAYLSPAGGPFSIMAWVYANERNNTRFLYDNKSGQSRTAVYIADNKIKGHMSDNSGRAITVATPEIRESRWYHIALVRDGNTLNMYFNGQLAATRTRTLVGINTNGGRTPIIGSDSTDLYDDQWEGSLDEFVIFKRALSAEEVAAAYEYYTNPPAPSPAP